MFKIKDEVMWCGVKGIVTGIYQMTPRCEPKLIVEFDAISYGINKAVVYFFMDGRHMHWHKEPSLKHVSSRGVRCGEMSDQLANRADSTSIHQSRDKPQS